jgi:COP9 signalosome complex subunit 3
LCAGRKQYGSALERLLAVLTAPSMVVNAITLTAYKKYVLVSLIQHGQVRGRTRHGQ